MLVAQIRLPLEDVYDAKEAAQTLSDMILSQGMDINVIDTLHGEEPADCGTFHMPSPGAKVFATQ